MSRKIRILCALFSSVAILAFAALMFLNRKTDIAEAGLQKTWLTMDAGELQQARDLAKSENRRFEPELVRIENGIAVVRATEDEISLISEQSHEKHLKCGGFMAHESEADALATIENFARVDNNAIAVEYTITNSATVQPLMNAMVASNIVQRIADLSSYTTRYYNSPEGVLSANYIKNTWTEMAQERTDVTVQFFTHPTWQQPSVILTIPGTTLPNEVVVLGAHQDSIRSGCSDQTTCQTLPAPGADDDASGIASLTELIRVAMVNNYRPARTVKFMAYAGEERGLLGSAAIASNFQSTGVNVVGMMQLDMTNYKRSTATFDIGLVTDFTNAAQNQFIRDIRAAYLPSVTITNTTCGYACSDHASWNNRGFPASFPHENTLANSNNLIHTANDTLANSDATGAHALKFSRLAAAYMGELAKGSLVTTPTPSNAKRADFDGDGKTDVSIFRPADGNWAISLSSNNSLSTKQFGAAGDRLAPQDYDGDDKTDFAVYRSGSWYVLNSQNNAFSAVSFGTAGDVSVPADYDGDGKADYAVFRPSNGAWYYVKSSDSQFVAAQFGANGDKPVAGDYDGDGKSDYAVYRPSNGTWYLMRSQTGFAATQFGLSTDRPVQADYDGDGKTDIGVYRDGNWYLQRSTAGFSAAQFGLASDVPAPGDYDGDGKYDLAVFRNDVWYLQRSTAGFTGISFGATGDKPIPAAYLP